MEKPSSPLSVSSLLCEEDESCFDEIHERGTDLDPFFVSESDDEEYIQMLVQREPSCYKSDSNACSNGQCSPKNEDNWLKSARLDAINWMLNTRAFFGFRFRTAYLSLFYFDRFFFRRSIRDGKLWAIRLLSVACLSLAAKMEECSVPALSQYPIDDYNFEGHVIQRMELLVLNTLEWKMNSATPFSYLPYFITKFCDECESNHKELLISAAELILAILKEISLVECRPSVIAVAAVLAACKCEPTLHFVEFKMSVIPGWDSLRKEAVFSCYNLLLRMEKIKSNTPTSLIARDIVTLPSSADGIGSSSISSAVGIKRRLTYNENSQLSPSKKVHGNNGSDTQ